MGAPSRLVDLESLAQDMARLEMDRDTADIVFVVILTYDILSIHQRFCLVRHGRHVNWRISATVYLMLCLQVGRDEARVSGHAAVFSVR